MDDAPPPDMPLSQNLAVLRQCITTLDTAAARAPAVTHTLQETVGALREVEERCTSTGTPCGGTTTSPPSAGWPRVEP